MRYIRKRLKQLKAWWISIQNDPVKSCKVFKMNGCAHVDGMLCNMSTCEILEDYKTKELEQQLDIPLKHRMK